MTAFLTFDSFFLCCHVTASGGVFLGARSSLRLPPLSAWLHDNVTRAPSVQYAHALRDWVTARGVCECQSHSRFHSFYITRVLTCSVSPGTLPQNKQRPFSENHASVLCVRHIASVLRSSMNGKPISLYVCEYVTWYNVRSLGLWERQM